MNRFRDSIPTPLECLKAIEEYFHHGYNIEKRFSGKAAVNFLGSYMPTIRASIAKGEAEWLAQIDRDILRAQFKRGLRAVPQSSNLNRRRS